MYTFFKRDLYKIKWLIIFLFISSSYAGYSQINNMPCSPIRLCETKSLNNSYPGQSQKNYIHAACGASTFTRTVFYKLIIKGGNKFTFKIKPDKESDYDWAVWKNISNCNNVWNVIPDRFSANDGIASYPIYAPNWDTGLDISKPSFLVCQKQGSANDGILAALDVNIGDEILLAIELAQSENGISDYLLSFGGNKGGGGNATFLCIEEYNPFYVCDVNNDNIEKNFDLNKVKENIIKEYLIGNTNYDIKFYRNEKDLVKNINSVNYIDVINAGAKIYCNIIKPNKDIYSSLSIDLNLVKYPVGKDIETMVCTNKINLHQYDNLLSAASDKTVFYYDNVIEAQKGGQPLTMPVTTNGKQTFYALIKTNKGGCSIIRNLTLIPPINSQVDPIMVCNGENAVLTVKNPVSTVRWYNVPNGGFPIHTGTSFILGTQINQSNIPIVKNYYVEQAGANNCTQRTLVTVTVLPKSVVDLGPDQTVCQGSSVTLDAKNPGATYLWNTGATTQTITVTTSGTYSVTVTNANGCTATDEVQIIVSPKPVVNLGPDQTICEGTAVILDAKNPGATYLWNTGATTQTITVTTPGTYSVTATNANGCVNTGEVKISVNPKPIVNLGSDQTICEGTVVTLDAKNPGATYLWNTGATTQTISVTASGTYSVTVTNNYGCSTTSSMKINFNNPFVKEVKVDHNTAEVVAIGIAPLQYSLDKIYWQSSPVFYNLSFKVYDAYVRNASGCTSKPYPFGILNVPNVITPNGDGINEIWNLKGLEIYPGSTVKIFDRYGKLLVNTKIEKEFIWDGKYLGRSVPTDTYWYIIELTDGRKLTGWLVVRNYNEKSR